LGVARLPVLFGPDFGVDFGDRTQPRRLPAHHGAAAEGVVYISICSGGAMMKISAAEQSHFTLGQLIIFGVAIVVILVELAIWLAN
jgi:hypothetical protein